MNDPSEIESLAEVAPISQFELEELWRQLEAEQNLTRGIIGGVIGMVIGTTLWILITVLSNYQNSWMAVGVGLLVGSGVRDLGKGFEGIFGIVGGSLAGLGCLLGNLIAVLIIVARELEIPFIDLLIILDLGIVIDLMAFSFSFLDLVFYGFAIYTGYHISFRRITEEDLAQRITSS
jgi:hypothetical protein